MFGLNPKKMGALMKQMGITQHEILSKRVIIEKEDGRIVIENPSVFLVKMKGQESFQVTGDVREENDEFEISQEDVKTIIEKTGCSEKEARESLEKTRDLAETILELSK